MPIDVCHYWAQLLATLDEFASCRISYDEYLALVYSLRSELGDSCTSFTAMTLFECVPLGSAILSALADVSAVEAETEESLRATARELRNLYYRTFVSHELMYTQPVGSSVFGPEGIPVISDTECLPQPVGEFLDFSMQSLSVPGELSPETIRRLHSVYLTLTPTTVLYVLCIEALQALLPWLSQGVFMEDDLSVYETRSWHVDASSLESFQHWASRLQGRTSFSVSLRYYWNNVLIRIDDWRPLTVPTA